VVPYLKSFVLLGCALLCGAQTLPELRLPDSVAPLSYDANITLDPARDQFSGKIRITLEVKRPVSVIWLN
jgi:hypothetical protein